MALKMSWENYFERSDETLDDKEFLFNCPVMKSIDVLVTNEDIVRFQSSEDTGNTVAGKTLSC